MQSSNEATRNWLALYLVPNLTVTQFHRLLSVFGSPGRILRASLKDLRKKGKLSLEKAEGIKNAFSNPWFIREWEKVVETDTKIIHFDSDWYPSLLKQIYVPPPLLYYRGEIAPSDRVCISIVGTRNPTNYGTAIAEKIASELASEGVTIVSGFARGIDIAALKGALSVSGNVISVLGNGLEKLYPKENLHIAEIISKKGALVSEFPLMTPPMPGNFPRRNRVISGLSIATVIVEAPEFSGALITARFAIEQGREVFVVPGNINCPQNVGSNKLIREGAKMMLHVQDILEDLQLGNKNVHDVKHDENKPSTIVHEDLGIPEKILSVLSDKDHLHVDEISRITLLPVQEVLSCLMMLELEEKVVQKNFMMFSRKTSQV